MNFNCQMCPRSFKDFPGHLSLGDFQWLRAATVAIVISFLGFVIYCSRNFWNQVYTKYIAGVRGDLPAVPPRGASLGFHEVSAREMSRHVPPPPSMQESCMNIFPRIPPLPTDYTPRTY